MHGLAWRSSSDRLWAWKVIDVRRNGVELGVSRIAKPANGGSCQVVDVASELKLKMDKGCCLITHVPAAVEMLGMSGTTPHLKLEPSCGTCSTSRGAWRGSRNPGVVAKLLQPRVRQCPSALLDSIHDFVPCTPRSAWTRHRIEALPPPGNAMPRLSQTQSSAKGSRSQLPSLSARSSTESFHGFVRGWELPEPSTRFSLLLSSTERYRELLPQPW